MYNINTKTQNKCDAAFIHQIFGKHLTHPKQSIKHVHLPCILQPRQEIKCTPYETTNPPTFYTLPGLCPKYPDKLNTT